MGNNRGNRNNRKNRNDHRKDKNEKSSNNGFNKKNVQTIELAGSPQNGKSANPSKKNHSFRPFVVNEFKENQMAHDFFKIDESSIANCPYCDKPVKYLSTAIQVKGSDLPVHFDCVLKKIEETETLLPNEKVTYLGKGVFGVIEKTEAQPGFIIKRKFEIEETQEPILWRKELSGRIKNWEIPNPSKK